MTILIKGVQVVSGGSRLSHRSDIFISGDKISAIGSFPARLADHIIDGQGCFVSAGFIDLNTDSDHYLTIFSNPEQTDFTRQGVTTIVGGQCGSSLAPLLYGRLDSIRKWADISRYNVNWHEMKEFLALLDKKPLGVNFATLIGHSTIRRDIAGEEDRKLTSKELDVFFHIISEALEQGGFGFSTGLGYAHGQNTPEDELVFLANSLKKRDALYATHLRKQGSPGLLNSVKETISLLQKVGVSGMINHFFPIIGQEGAYDASIEFIDTHQDIPLYFNFSPFGTSILPLYTFLPEWARKGNLESMEDTLEDSRLQRAIVQDIQIPNPDEFVVSRAEGNDVLVGRSLSDIMDFYELKTPEEALLKIMLTTRLRASVFYEDINTEKIINLIRHPRCLISSNAASFSSSRQILLVPERARRTFPKFLSLVFEKQLMPIEEAIQKVTEIPAKLLHLKKRGLVKEGFYADLVGFTKTGEIQFTIVNGRLAFSRESMSDIRSGRIFRHHID